MEVLKDSDKVCPWMTFSLCSVTSSVDMEEVSEALEVSAVAEVSAAAVLLAAGNNFIS